jgi:hypothetical protein
MADSTSNQLPEVGQPEKFELPTDQVEPPFVRTEALNPEELDKDESETLDYLSNAALDQISLPAVAALAADEIFGKDIDSDKEDLFLNAILDDTQPLQSELMAKLEAMFDANGFMAPDRYSFQVFKRKAGYAPNNKTSDDDLARLGQYCAAICLKDYQVVVYDRKEHILSSGMISPVFELKPHEEGKKVKLSPRPSVPRNRTQIKIGQGKATIKPRNFLCILVWAFWDGHPIKVAETKMDGSNLQNVIDRLKDSILERTERETVIYDSLDDASKAIGTEIGDPNQRTVDAIQAILKRKE